MSRISEINSAMKRYINNTKEQKQKTSCGIQSVCGCTLSFSSIFQKGTTIVTSVCFRSKCPSSGNFNKHLFFMDMHHSFSFSSSEALLTESEIIGVVPVSFCPKF